MVHLAGGPHGPVRSPSWTGVRTRGAGPHPARAIMAGWRPRAAPTAASPYVHPPYLVILVVEVGRIAVQRRIRRFKNMWLQQQLDHLAVAAGGGQLQRRATELRQEAPEVVEV